MVTNIMKVARGAPGGSSGAARQRPRPASADVDVAKGPRNGSAVPISAIEQAMNLRMTIGAPPAPLDMAALAEMRADLAGEPRPAWGVCKDDRPDCGPWKISKAPPRTPPVTQIPMNERKRILRPPVALAARSARKNPGVSSGLQHCCRASSPYCRASSPYDFLSGSTEGEDAFASRLSARLKEVSAARPEVPFWVIVEVCHDCDNHGPSVRHDEAAYRSRYIYLSHMIEDSIPNACCAPLGGTGAGGAARIGAFEVYLCCNSSICGADAANGLDGAILLKGGWVATCLASKLSSRAWPQLDVVLQKLKVAVPRVQLQLRVITSTGLPIPNVILEGAPFEFGGVTTKSTTGPNGVGQLSVPLGSTLHLKISRDDGVVMDQMRQLVIGRTGLFEEFVVRRVLKLLQSQVEDELVVYCFSPRAATQPSHMIPFKGFIQQVDGNTLEPDNDGLFRESRDKPDPLQGMDLACCDGWRSSKVKEIDPRFGAAGLHELARLVPPATEVSLVSNCCDTPLPGALFAIDGKNIGRTIGDGTLQQAIVCGERRVCVQHALICNSLERVFTIENSMSSGLKVLLPTDGLRLVSSISPLGAKDVWLVPTNGADAIGHEAWNGTLADMPVVNGVLPQEARQRMSEVNADCCCWATWLNEAVDARGLPLILRPKFNNRNCIIGELSRNGAVWVGQEAFEVAECQGGRDESESDSGVTSVNLTLRTSCCGCGISDVSAVWDSERTAPSGPDGCIHLKTKNGALSEDQFAGTDLELLGHLGQALPNFPAQTLVLNLPRSSYSQSRPVPLEIVVRCAVFAFVLLPEDDEDTGCASLCAVENQIPEGAIPVTGKLCCPGTHEREICLDGTSFGPFTLHSTSSADGRPCFIQHITLETAVQGMNYRVRDPSPLLERHDELGGCELQRLASCPVALGFLEPDGSIPIIAVAAAGGDANSYSADSDWQASGASSIGNTRGLPCASQSCSFDQNGEAVSLPPQATYLPSLPPNSK